MLPAEVLERFVECCPAAVMVRAVLENLLRPERLDEVFQRAAQRQYSRQLLFSQLVAIMSAVATRSQPSVHAAYLAAQDKLDISPQALYDKLRRLEPAVTAALVRETARDAARAIDALPGLRPPVLTGGLKTYDVYCVDGNHLASTEHRLAELRTTREAALPGQTLALLDLRRGLITELVPGEDGHAQERSLVPELLERLRKGMVLVADRNFCTSRILFGIVQRSAFFVIRQHGSTLSWEREGKRRRIGRTVTGMMFEQILDLNYEGQTLPVRRLTIELDGPTNQGESEVHILTNLPAETVPAGEVVEAYRLRWTIEEAFQCLTEVLRCEVETLGYPRAALFSFAVAVVAWNTYAVVKGALKSVHGWETIEATLSDYHLMHDVLLTHCGLEIAVEASAWFWHQGLCPQGLAKELVRLAKTVKLSRYPKRKRGPKHPPPAKTGRRNDHLSTARLLEKRKDKRP
ncbi:IS4 family transposase [Planctomyces sp. SH-PL14]|uniref:IS4 family transposase n=1 Tax=Planctomyces sp. SH-PL14 TaxID=1632864 RepID=UPI00078E4FC2|nr:IS4 family transposase [Planctomyces sp. SH-PL14]AMV21336.1 Transposase DDE domain protein [Planctomyces sp. SH-PL14]